MKTAMIISFAGMATPFALGAALGFFLYNFSTLYPHKTSQMEAMLFLGASMCITAFPMLARIIHFKGLSGTRMGTVAISAGAIDDASAWCLLAVVLASFDGTPFSAVATTAGGGLFVAAMLFVVRPLMGHAQSLFRLSNGTLSDTGFVVGIAAMALSAWFTDLLGLHAVFGAFIAGTAIPRGIMTRDLCAQIQPLTVTLLLPLFFTYSGLNTRIDLLDSWFLWAICGLVLGAAVLGKGVACWLAARASGLPNMESIGLGVLMNARGLMELIIINIGLQRGIISEGLFATLVIMAVLTTLMASPIFDRVVGVGRGEVHCYDLSAAASATPSGTPGA